MPLYSLDNGNKNVGDNNGKDNGNRNHGDDNGNRNGMSFITLHFSKSNVKKLHLSKLTDISLQATVIPET